jgi:zinc transporter 2
MLIIWIITAYLLYVAIGRLYFNDFNVEAELMLCVALVGLIANMLMIFVLETPVNYFNHHHSHKSVDVDKCEKNINQRAAFVHIIGDILQSIGVIVASLIILVYPTLKIFDPICTILFSFIVLATTCPTLIDIVNVLLESSPDTINRNNLAEGLTSVKHVKHVHGLYVWYLGLDSYALNVHVVIDDFKYFNFVLSECNKLVFTQYASIKHINVQIENGNESAQICGDCEKPTS